MTQQLNLDMANDHSEIEVIEPSNNLNTNQESVLTRGSSNSSNIDMENNQEKVIDYFKRASWLRAGTLGAIDGLISTASVMMGVDAVKQDLNIMIITGFAGLVAGACSMAIGEFVSVYSQNDIKKAHMRRNKRGEIEKKKLQSPTQASLASVVGFCVGAIVPLLAGGFVKDYKERNGAIVAAVTLGLVMIGWLPAVLGKAPVVKSLVRVVIGGWLAMAITFGFTKLLGLKVH